MQKYFSFEVTILDDKNIRRRFRASNYQTTTRVKPFICTMPMKLDRGFNQIQFNLSDFTRRAYGTNYLETLRVQIHCSCRIRRVFFTDRLYSEEDLPLEYRLFRPEGVPSAPGHGLTATAGMGSPQMMHQQGQPMQHEMDKMPLQQPGPQGNDMMMMNMNMDDRGDSGAMGGQYDDSPQVMESGEAYPTAQAHIDMEPVEVEEGKYSDEQPEVEEVEGKGEVVGMAGEEEEGDAQQHISANIGDEDESAKPPVEVNGNEIEPGVNGGDEDKVEPPQEDEGEDSGIPEVIEGGDEEEEKKAPQISISNEIE